jgi:drug/metabolite transporter (DMT)-like permease
VVRERWVAVLALLCAMIVWGSTFIATKILLEESGPFFVTMGRFLIGLAVLLPFAYRAGFYFGLALRPSFLLFGLTGVALFFGLQNLGLLFTSASTAALIHAGVPAAVAVLAYLFLNERIPRMRLLGIGISVFGVVLVSGAMPTDRGPLYLLGNALIVGSVLAYGAYATQGKALRTGDRYPATVATAASFAAGLIFLSPFVVGELLLIGAPELSFRGWLILLYLGVGASALTLFLWNFALRYMEATAAAIYINLIPVIGLLFALALGESVLAVQLLGGTLAIAGVLLSESTTRRNARNESKSHAVS